MALLKYREDRRTLLFVAITFALSLGGYAYGSRFPWWVQVPWVLATGWFSWLCAVITHNTIHVPMFHSRRLNLLFQHVLTLAYGHPVSSFVPGHNLSHHVHTQTRRDVMRTTKMRFRWNLLNLVLAPPVLARDIMAADGQYALAMRSERPRWFRQWVAEWVVFLSVQGVLLALNPLAYLIWVFLPHNCAAGGIVGINFLQHDGTDRDARYDHSRNFVGPIINWFAFNNGFHAIHHMRPGLHWSRCREAHEREVAPFVDPRLNEPNMLAYIVRAHVWPGRRLDFRGNPVVLPEEGPDLPWIPKRGESGDASLGAVEA
jgi:fatty acid desaturase